MVEGFRHHFATQYPEREFEQEWERFRDMPVLGTIMDMAMETVHSTEEVKILPERNQNLIEEMAKFMIEKGNRIVKSPDAWRENYWGLYIVGSRARGDAKPDSDLDLLSVGTFYRNQGFDTRTALGDDENIFEGFDLKVPEELPDEYNVGKVDRKYLVRATPQNQEVLRVDLSVVDLTFLEEVSLNIFKNEMDVDADGRPLGRIPLLELIVDRDPFAVRI